MRKKREIEKKTVVWYEVDNTNGIDYEYLCDKPPIIHEVHLLYVDPLKAPYSKPKKHYEFNYHYVDLEQLIVGCIDDYHIHIGLDLVRKKVYELQCLDYANHADYWSASCYDEEDQVKLCEAYLKYEADKAINKMLGDDDDKRDNRGISKARRTNTKSRGKSGTSQRTKRKEPK